MQDRRDFAGNIENCQQDVHELLGLLADMPGGRKESSRTTSDRAPGPRRNREGQIVLQGVRWRGHSRRRRANDAVRIRYEFTYRVSTTKHTHRH